jgi:hypothetical protein
VAYLTPAQARTQADQKDYGNSAKEREFRAEIDRIIADAARPVYESAVNALKETNEEAATYARAAAAHVKAASDLQVRMKNRDIHPADARKERDRLVREGMRLHQLLDSLTKTYENNLYIRDHPEETLNTLYERYPSLERPYFPI